MTITRHPASSRSKATGEAARRCQVGPENREAWADLWEQIKGLIYQVSFRFPTTTTCDRDDLIQAGWVGVQNSVREWDEQRGEFLTYAGKAAFRTMQRQLSDVGRVVKLPPNHARPDDPRACIRAKAALILNAKHSGYLTGLDAEWLTDKGDHEGDVDEADDRANQRATVSKLLDTLAVNDPVSVAVVRLRLGLGGEPMEGKEIGEHYGKTRAWAYIRYLEAIQDLRLIADGKKPRKRKPAKDQEPCQ